MVIEKTIKITRSRSGIPCLWESLTTFDNLTRATVILSAQGEPKKAFYLNENREKEVPVKRGAPVLVTGRTKGSLRNGVWKSRERTYKKPREMKA